MARRARRNSPLALELHAALEARCSAFAAEKLGIKNIAATASDMMNEPGTNVAGKSALNAESGL